MKTLLNQQGFAIAEHIFSDAEIEQLRQAIADKTSHNPNFRVNKDLFAIRNLLHEIPDIARLVATERFCALLRELMPGNGFFAIKGIFFDKPPLSNWVVNWHQDLTISVDQRHSIEGFTNWTLKAGEHCVQPSLDYLHSIVTLRIHLDDCEAANGAVKVIPGSHAHGVLNDEQVKAAVSSREAVTCEVKKGGVLIMKPLLLHASSRSSSPSHRRVIHLEFSTMELPEPLQWREKDTIN